MSSKTVSDHTGKPGPRARHPFSIALRMTLWYALSAFALIFISTGLLYWALVTGMYHEDLRDLADNLNNARLLLPSARTGERPQALKKPPSWAPAHQPEIYLRLLDADGRTVTQTPGMAAELPPPTKAQLASVAVPDGEKREMLSRSGKPFLTLIVRVAGLRADGPPQFLEVAMDRAHDEYLLARYRERLWIVLGTSLILCSVIGYLIARSGMRPIEKIGRTAAHIRSATLHERIERQGLPAEVATLADTFNGMLDRLEDSFQHISQFSDDVAHELRTPINSLRGEIEVALRKVRTPEEYREVLGSCLEECARISRLIQTLLFLARADAATDGLQRETIDVGQELARVEAYYGAAAAEAGIDLRVSAASRVHARLDRTLFQQAVGNLLSNAIAHTPTGGSVDITVSAEPARLVVGVRDTGCGMAAEHLPRVFDRFYRVDRARSRSAQNVGLGLAVVKSIVTRHGGHVEIDSAVGRGTEVRLVLPTPG